ncbi:unnamed protein product [Protopolystoma xenopodis]|uniref:Uncharacterized protein n=1 Tax=Protopolystoma xenopodis TaxID=117903 RepID=A0A3S5B4U1_9PLAT|nr:unnamed protein product [Protopolystoma xenopodis]
MPHDAVRWTPRPNTQADLGGRGRIPFARAPTTKGSEFSSERSCGLGPDTQKRLEQRPHDVFLVEIKSFRPCCLSVSF